MSCKSISNDALDNQVLQKQGPMVLYDELRVKSANEKVLELVNILLIEDSHLGKLPKLNVQLN